MAYLCGEVIWAHMGAMLGSPSPFGDVQPIDPTETSNFDYGAGWQDINGPQTGPTASSQPDTNAYSGASYVDHGRWARNSSVQMAPLLLREPLGPRFGAEVQLIEWAPDPAVQRSYGMGTPTIQHQLPQVAKRLPSYDYSAYDSQAILEEAMDRVRRSLYGR